MRDLRPKPMRQSSQSIPQLPQSSDSGLSEIMNRRRQMADAGRSEQVPDPFAVKKKDTATAPAVNSDLFQAMQRRRQTVDSGQASIPSPRANRGKLNHQHHVAMSSEFQARINGREPLVESPRQRRGSPGRYKHVKLLDNEVEKALTKRFGTLEEGGSPTPSAASAARQRSSVTEPTFPSVPSIPFHGDEEGEAADDEHGDRSSTNNDSFVEDYTPADASVQEASYAESHNVRSRNSSNNSNNLRDDPSVDGASGDESSVPDVAAEEEDPDQSYSDSRDGFTTDDDEQQQQQQRHPAPSRSFSGGRGEDGFTTDEDAGFTTDEDNHLGRGGRRRVRMGEDGNNTSDEDLDLLEDDQDHDGDDNDSYSSDEFPEHDGNFTDDDADFISDDENNDGDDEDYYTSDDQDPYYTTDDGGGGGAGKDYNSDDGESYYEEETYYSGNQTVENEQRSLPRDSSFFTTQSITTMRSLGTLSEEGTVDLMDDSESQQQEGRGSSIYEEQTVYDEETVYSNNPQGRSNYDEHAVGPTTSFYSTNAGNSRGNANGNFSPKYYVPEVKDQVQADEEEDEDESEQYDDFNVNQLNQINHNSYDAERSILDSFSGLHAVPEESTIHTTSSVEEASKDVDDDQSVDESTIFGSRLGEDDPKGNSGPLPSRLMDSMDGEPMDLESGNASRRSRDPPAKAPFKSKKEQSQPRKVRRFCTLPWLIAIVLVTSLLIGIFVGILLFGGFKKDSDSREPVDNDQEEEGASKPTVVDEPERPELPEGQLAVYDTLCSVVEDCGSLLDISTPQGQSFDWLVNDNLANPDLEALGEERQIRRFALATIYFSTGGESWETRQFWLSDFHECDWFSSAAVGSGCSDGETFDKLELNNNNLQGEVPKELFLLSSLTSISLKNPIKTEPFLRGSLPTGWTALVNLTSVTISGNQFSGSILDEFGALVNLEKLDLSYNGFNGEIPATFASLTKMISLNLAGNQLTGNINAGIFEGATALVDVNLHANSLTGVPSTIRGLSHLQSLNLASNNLSDFPYAVTDLADITSLDLSDNRFQDEIPVQIGKMEGLQSLNLSRNKFTHEIPVELGKLVQLTELLDLSFNELTGPLPTTLGNLVNLRRLLLNGNHLRGDLPVELAALDQVQEVRYDDNDFSGFVPDDICILYNNEPGPASFADCEELIFASCFTYCCTDGAGCVCRFELTEPLRCVKGLQ